MRFAGRRKPNHRFSNEADFTLIALARNMADFEELTHRLFFDDTNVKRFRTSVVMNRTKTGMTVPLGNSETN